VSMDTYVLNSVTEGLDGRKPCGAVNEQTGRNSRGVTTAKETRKHQRKFIEGYKKVAPISCWDLRNNSGRERREHKKLVLDTYTHYSE